MVERLQLWFWSSERLTRNKVYEMRIDLRSHGQHLDLVVKIRKVQLLRSSGFEKGYLHSAALSRRTPEKAQRLLEVFQRLNPELTGSEAAPTSPRRPRSERSSAAPRRGSAMSSAFDTDPGRRPRDASSRPRPSRPGPPAALASAPPAGERYHVTPVVWPGTPPAVMLHFPTVEALRADHRVENGDLFLYTGACRDLRERRTVMMHLQLPDGQHLSLPALVTESGSQRCALLARRVEHRILYTLTMASGNSTPR
jgi:hypothetical protein